MEFKDKVVMITGASSGMGKELAIHLSKKGCKIAIFARNEKKLGEICKEINKGISKCIYKKCDVTVKKDAHDAIDFTKEKFGCIDVAFLNAGILVPNPIQTFNSDIIIKTMKVNFFGQLYFIEKLLPLMKKQEKSFISMTSTLPDKRGVPGWGAYGASKAAVSWLAESLRVEAEKKYNIKIITLKPGSVETPMIKDYNRRGGVSSKKAAEHIIKGIEKEKKVIQFPFMQVFSTRFTDLFPTFAYDLQPVRLLKGEDYPEPPELEETHKK